MLHSRPSHSSISTSFSASPPGPRRGLPPAARRECAALTDLTVSAVWEIVRLQLAVFAFHDAVRTNDAALKRAARRAFLPVWFVRSHPNMARVVLDDERLYATAPDGIKRFLDRHASARRHEAYQGRDAILEEFNRLTKGWAAGVPDAERWRWICRCIHLLQLLRAKAQALFGTTRADMHAQRSQPHSSEELKAWRAVLASSRCLVRNPWPDARPPCRRQESRSSQRSRRAATRHAGRRGPRRLAIQACAHTRARARRQRRLWRAGSAWWRAVLRWRVREKKRTYVSRMF